MPVVIVIVVVLYLLFVSLEYLFANPGVLVGLLVCVGIIVFLRKRHVAVEQRRHRIALEERRKEQLKKEEERRNEEAIRTRQSQLGTLSSIASNSQQLARRLHDLVWEAEEKVAVAEHEFREGAFAPFWDAIEIATHKLATYSTILCSLGADASNHNRTVSGMARPVPDYPFSMKDLPNVSSAVNRLNAIVRQAQKDFRFSNIYEHRKTSRILVAGFSTLGVVLTELGNILDSSLREFRDSVSIDLSAQARATSQLSDRIDEIERRKNASSTQGR